MHTYRIFFSKQGTAAYISHLDLQRVFARALRKSCMPVWYSQGFNPHIYLNFALPLPLGQQSLCEVVEFKCENDEDIYGYLPALNAALPNGILANKIALPKYPIASISSALYRLRYFGMGGVSAALAQYSALPTAPVLRKTKSRQESINLKEILPSLAPGEDENTFFAQLPAGSLQNYNPQLLLGFLQGNYQLPASQCEILRKQVYVSGGQEFC